MARFSRGHDAEDRLITLLRGFGCKLVTDSQMDHERKIDFLVVGLPEFPRVLPAPIGVQVTLNNVSMDKRSEFFRRALNKPYAPKNLYLELAYELDLEEGGAFIVLTALTQFATDRRFADWKAGFLRIETDLSYEFQDAATALHVKTPAAPEAKAPPAVQPAKTPDPKPEQKTVAPVSPENQTKSKPNGAITTEIHPTKPQTNGRPSSGAAKKISGIITRFDTNHGVGVIHVAGNEKEFSVTRGNIQDAKLRRMLKATPGQEFKTPIAVVFKDGGPVEGKENNLATQVKRPPPH